MKLEKFYWVCFFASIFGLELKHIPILEIKNNIERTPLLVGGSPRVKEIQLTFKLEHHGSLRRGGLTTLPEGASWNQEAIPPEATQARKVHLWGQEGASWNQEAARVRRTNRARPLRHSFLVPPPLHAGEIFYLQPLASRASHTFLEAAA